MHRLVLQKETCLWVVNNIEQEHRGEREIERERDTERGRLMFIKTEQLGSVLELK